MTILKTKKLSIRLHPTVGVLIVISVLLGAGPSVLNAALALLWHESFHLAAALLLGATPCCVELTPFGGVMEANAYDRLPPSAQAMLAISGVLGSVLGFLMFRGDAGATQFARMCLCLALLNLLPVLPLDGGRVLSALLSYTPWHQNANRVLSLCAIAFGGLLCLLAVYGALNGHINLSLWFVGPYLCYSAYQSYASLLVRVLARSLQTREKLRTGGTLKVSGKALAAGADPNMLLHTLSPDRYTCILLINPETGKVEQTMNEDEIIAAILADTR